MKRLEGPKGLLKPLHKTMSACQAAPGTSVLVAAKAAPYKLRKLAVRQSAGSQPLQLLELQPEVLELVANKLAQVDLSALAATCHAATPLQSAVIGLRVAALRTLTAESHGHLVALIDRLPECPAKIEITSVIENSMVTFRSVCTCNEDFIRLTHAVALRGTTAPFNSPVDAARLARNCCQTCDDVTRALTAVSTWLTELTELICSSGRRGERALLEAGEMLSEEAEGELAHSGGGGAPPLVDLGDDSEAEEAPDLVEDVADDDEGPDIVEEFYEG